MDFVAWHNINSATLQATFGTYYHQGYRFVSLSIYGPITAPLFAAVMVRRLTVTPQYVRWGLGAADYQTAFDDYANQGLWATNHLGHGDRRAAHAGRCMGANVADPVDTLRTVSP